MKTILIVLLLSVIFYGCANQSDSASIALSPVIADIYEFKLERCVTADGTYEVSIYMPGGNYGAQTTLVGVHDAELLINDVVQVVYDNGFMASGNNVFVVPEPAGYVKFKVTDTANYDSQPCNAKAIVNVDQI
jgi:hypothetical protein